MNMNRLMGALAVSASAVLNSPAAEPLPLVWRVVKASDGCRAATAVETTRGGASLELLTRSPADDVGARGAQLH